MTDGGETMTNEGNAQPSVNTTKNVRNSACHYMPVMCTHYAFAGRRIPTNGLAALLNLFYV